MNERGVAIDEAALPCWARSRFSPAQLELSRGLLWLLLLYKWRGRHPSRKSVAQRLHAFTIGRDKKEWDPTFEDLAADLDLSPRTVEPALEELEEDGWILVTRLYRRNVYRLAWPLRDVLAPPTPGVPLCGAPTKKGGTCGKKAGRGTETPGVGLCIQHLEVPDEPEPQRLRSNSVGIEPQSLRSKLVDNSETEPRSTAVVADFDRSGCGVQPQPLRLSTATTAVPYVSTFSSFEVRPLTPVLAEGELTVRTAQAPHAPSANQSGFAARSLISAIPRYRAAPGWVKKCLATLADAALAAGFSRYAITHYAQMVITEARFAEHQHIPEFRDALRRLGRDTALGDLAPTVQPTPDTDAPWTDEDQAAWERVLDGLGVTPDDLDTTGTI